MKRSLLITVLSICITTFLLGQQNDYSLEEYNKLIAECINQRNYAQLLPLAQQGLAKAEENGVKDTTYSKMLYAVGFGYQTRGQFREAEQYFQDALTLQEELAPNSVLYSNTLSNFARLQSQKDNYDKALEMLDECYNIRKEILGEKHQITISSMLNIGLTYKEKGDYIEAETILLEANALKKEILGREHLEYAQTQSILGSLYLAMGKYDAAEKSYLEALELRRLLKGDNHPLYAQSLGDLASLYDEMGRYDEAIKLYEETLVIQKNTLGEQHRHYFVTVNNLAATYIKIKNYVKAKYHYNRIVEVKKETNQTSDVAYSVILNNLGDIAFLENNYSEAVVYANEALEIRKAALGEYHPLIASSLNILSRTYLELGHYDKAQVYSDQTIDVYLKTLGEQHPSTIGAWGNQLKIYEAQGKDSSAWAIVDTIFYLNTGFIPPNTIDEKWLEVLTEADYISIGYMLEALKVVKQLAKKRNAEEEIWVVKLALALLDNDRMSLADEGNKTRLLKDHYEWVVSGLELTSNEVFFEDAFAFAEQGKSILVLDALQRGQAYTLGALPDSIAQQEQELYKQQARIKAQLLERNPKVIKDSLLKSLNQLNIELNQFNQQVKQDYPTQVINDAISVEIIQGTLPKHAALIEYVVTDSVLYIFYIDKQQTKLLTQSLSAYKLNTNIGVMHRALSDYGFIENESEKAYNNYVEAAYWFYQNLVAPLEIDNREIQQLMIVPDGKLGNIPFETFLTEEASGRDYHELPYLLNTYEVSYNYAASLWVNNKAQNTSNNGLIFGVAADYGNKDDKSITELRLPTYRKIREYLVPLPAARQEVTFLQTKFDGYFAFDSLATESIFKQHAQDYSVIHLAMHGLLNENTPTLSSLAFTEDGDSVNNNFLQAYEIAKMKLNADLVVLSACETGYGKFETGNGIASLARAFMYAGVPAMVVSLWQVNDQATSSIMESFYTNIAAGKPKNTALQLAKLDYIRSKKGKAAHPAYWSPFIQIGNEEPVQLQSGGIKWLWYVGAGIAIVFVVFLLAKRKKAA